MENNQLQKKLNLHSIITQKDNQIELMQIEKRLTIQEVLKSIEPVFNEISKNFKQESNTLYCIDILCQRFIKANYPDTNHIEVSQQFSNDILEIKTDWKLADIIIFFKYVRQNQHIKELKVMGNKINGLKLMEFANIYDDFRANERTKIFRENKTEKSNEIPKTVMEQLMEIVTKIKNKPKKDTSGQILARNEKRNKMNAEIKRLHNLVLNGDITEMDAVGMYNEFLKKNK